MSKDKAGSPKPQITLPDYCRIYEVISVLEGRARTPFAYTFFAIACTFILQEHHKIAARPVVGALSIAQIERALDFGSLVAHDHTQQ